MSWQALNQLLSASTTGKAKPMGYPCASLRAASLPTPWSQVKYSLSTTMLINHGKHSYGTSRRGSRGLQPLLSAVRSLGKALTGDSAHAPIVAEASTVCSLWSVPRDCASSNGCIKIFAAHQSRRFDIQDNFFVSHAPCTHRRMHDAHKGL